MRCKTVILNKVGKTRNDTLKRIVVFVSNSAYFIDKFAVINLVFEVSFDLSYEFSDVVCAEFTSSNIAEHLFQVSWGNLTQIVDILLLKEIKEFSRPIFFINFVV